MPRRWTALPATIRVRVRELAVGRLERRDARRDAVHGDAVSTHLTGHPGRHVLHRVLREAVGVPTRARRHRGDVDDPPPCAVAHQRHRGLVAPERSGHVHGPGRVPDLVRALEQTRLVEPTPQAGVVHQDVEASELCRDARHHRIGTRSAGHVDVDADAPRADAELSAAASAAAAAVSLTSASTTDAPSLGEVPRVVATEATRGAGHDHDPFVESTHGYDPASMIAIWRVRNAS